MTVGYCRRPTSWSEITGPLGPVQLVPELLAHSDQSLTKERKGHYVDRPAAIFFHNLGMPVDMYPFLSSGTIMS